MRHGGFDLSASCDTEEGALNLRLDREPRAAAEAREFIDKQLGRRGIDELVIEKARLLTSELVTNACKYGKGRVEVRIGFPPRRVRLEVIDEGKAQSPAVREQPGDGDGGWGLQIVDRLAAQWGVFEGTTHVWADLLLAE